MAIFYTAKCPNSNVNSAFTLTDKETPMSEMNIKLGQKAAARLKTLADLKGCKPEEIVTNALAVYEFIVREQIVDPKIEIWTTKNGEPLQEIEIR